MARNYIHTLFTPSMRALQEADGSREAYARMEAGADGKPDELTEKEREFIAARDSFYIASVTEGGWPYVQHRGGPRGFLKVIGETQLGMADFRGNRQHVSTANIMVEPRVSIFLMDYAGRRRLKLLAHARVVTRDEDARLVTTLMPDGYKALPERAYIFDLVGWDWNCPQHITRRFTEPEIEALLQPIIAERDGLRAELAALRGD
ncbi:pyridoxamine 5'-phosphate oxidase family protein [Altererythrobacter sp.]|uniref:pyridoxamine 5'-phosphate oxidase family protein n=1 Tax=Altererythrobacter sp. TaxID=1872480 RepID=UPI003CFD734F